MNEKRARYPYRYETHLHTSEGSRCASKSAREQIELYASMGYTGVFITDHFWGNSSCRVDPALSFEAQVEQYFLLAEKAKEHGVQCGLDVFTGIEYTYLGTDFLIYGLTPEVISRHPEIPDMKPHEFVRFARENGALAVHAHPFRHSRIIRLMPREVDCFEVRNGCNTDFENRMARIFAREYKVAGFAGSDNHGHSEWQKFYAGIDTSRRIKNEQDLVKIIKDGKYRIFGK